MTMQKEMFGNLELDKKIVAALTEMGFMLSRECRRLGVDVECLPGATAFVPALVASGLPCDRFVFEGFLPLKKGRATRLRELAEDPRSVIIYEIGRAHV